MNRILAAFAVAAWIASVHAGAAFFAWSHLDAFNDLLCAQISGPQPESCE